MTSPTARIGGKPQPACGKTPLYCPINRRWSGARSDYDQNNEPLVRS